MYAGEIEVGGVDLYHVEYEYGSHGNLRRVTGYQVIANGYQELLNLTTGLDIEYDDQGREIGNRVFINKDGEQILHDCTVCWEEALLDGSYFHHEVQYVRVGEVQGVFFHKYRIEHKDPNNRVYTRGVKYPKHGEGFLREIWHTPQVAS